jgi:hypothetical protein
MRAFLNVTNDLSGSSVIDPAQWAACLSPFSSPGSGLGVGFALTSDRGTGVVAVAGYNGVGKIHVELVDVRAGAGWLADRVAGLQSSHGAGEVVVDRGGPESSVLPGLGEVRTRVIGTTDMCRACGEFLDAVQRGDVAHLGDPRLDAVVGESRKRRVQNMWLWDRTMVPDAAPLVAVTAAYWSLTTTDTEPERAPLTVDAPGVY